MMGESSSWIIQIQDALERDEVDDAPEFFIWKVPSIYRTSVELYEPRHWRFGLHHCYENLQADESEGFKVDVVRALGLTRDRWDHFCKRMVLEPKCHWEAVYKHSPHVRSYSIDEIRCRLALDAVSLIVIYQLWGGVKSLGPALQKVASKNEIQHALWETFCMVENQIPLELLERAVGILVNECKEYVGIMQEWDSIGWKQNIYKCVWWKTFHSNVWNAPKEEEVFQRSLNSHLPHFECYHGVHILDSTYRLLCGWESLAKIHRKHKIPYNYSAGELEAGGVAIKGIEFTSFEKITFENGCLSVPYFQVLDATELYLRDLAVYETLTRHPGGQHYAARLYAYFMGALMKTSEDVLLLENLGVVSVQVSGRSLFVI